MSATVDIVNLLVVTRLNRRVVLTVRVVVMSFEVGCFFVFSLPYYNNIIVLL